MVVGKFEMSSISHTSQIGEYEENEYRCQEFYRDSVFSNAGQESGISFDPFVPHTIITFGASGDLARKKLYPTLWLLYKNNLLPENTLFLGYARSKLTVDDLRKNAEPHSKVDPKDEEKYAEFWTHNQYMSGEYMKAHDMQLLNELISKNENNGHGNRIFYFAVPSIVYECLIVMIKEYCLSNIGWTRVVVEKPHGRDTESSKELNKCLREAFSENQIYRMDHYLGKEMVQNIMTLRFSNEIFRLAWSRISVASVLITLKETIDVDQRGSYFDQYGIIRDVMQNHLLQILSLTAMDTPVSCSADDVRNAKLKVLKQTKIITFEDIVVGQYVGNPNGKTENMKVGYRDAPNVARDSIQSTFATAVLRISNERWEGVPFILKCGKALNARKTEVRIQFKDVPNEIFSQLAKRNELVIRVQPNEAVYIKVMIKSPGAGFDVEESELDLTYSKRYNNVILPDAYERLILDVFCGMQMHFIHADEMVEGWRIFTPILHKLENERIKPIEYLYGSRGPKESDELLRKNNFVYTGTYTWNSL